MKRTFISTFLFAMAMLSLAAEQKISFTTARPVGQSLALFVNATRHGVTVDWGDGNPIAYKPAEPGGVLEISGTIVGPNIVLSAGRGLNTFGAEDCDITSIDLSAATELRSLYLQHNQLTSIDVANLTALVDLNLADNQLAAVSLSATKQANIESLDISSNPLSATTFSYATPKLRYLNLAHNQYRSLSITKAINLDALLVSDNDLTAISLAGPAAVSLLDARDNQVSKITIPPTGLPNLQQCLVDDNAISSLDLSASPLLNTLTIARNGAEAVVLPAKAKLQVYDCSDNALSFGSLPAKTAVPSVYFAYAPQADLDISNAGLHTASWGSNYLPWLMMNPDYSSRSDTKYQLDLTSHKDGSATGSVEFKLYSVADGQEVLLEKATASQRTLDYSLVSGKMTILKEFDDLFIEMTDPFYTDLVIRTNHFAVIDGMKEGIGHIEVSHSESLPVYDLQGRPSVPSTPGLYIVNGKKIIVK